MAKARLVLAPDGLRKAVREIARETQGETGYEGSGWGPHAHMHPPVHRRCQSLRRDGSGRQCNCWALPGSRFCHLHRGRRTSILQQVLEGGDGGHRAIGSTAEVQMFYGKHLSKTLQTKLQECLDVDESEQTNLLEELALAKATLLDAAKVYDETRELVEAAELGGNASQATLDAAKALRAETGASMRQVIKDVADIADRIERHRAARKSTDGVSVHALAWVAKQFAELAHQLCGDDLELARRFEEGARRIRLPDAQALMQGTMLTPDQQVLAMDETIPREGADG